MSIKAQSFKFSMCNRSKDIENLFLAKHATYALPGLLLIPTNKQVHEISINLIDEFRNKIFRFFEQYMYDGEKSFIATALTDL